MYSRQIGALAILALCLSAGAAPAQPAKEIGKMNPQQASAFAKLALKGIRKEYPNKPGHVLNEDADNKTPKALHPAFYGCYDWHSSVHGHWMLVRLLRRFPELPEQVMRVVWRTSIILVGTVIARR